MNSISKSIFTSIFIASLVGCGGSAGPDPKTNTDNSSGRLVTDQDLCNFVYETTTKDEVVALLGQPNSTNGDSEILWLDYKYQQGASMMTTSMMFHHTLEQRKQSNWTDLPMILTGVYRIGNISTVGPVPSCLTPRD